MKNVASEFFFFFFNFFHFSIPGFIGNGTYCIEPVRQESAFLLLSQGVAIVKIPADGKRGFPIAMSGVSATIIYTYNFTTKIIIINNKKFY